MEFMLDIAEYGIAEFYETFCRQFPMLAMVTVGYCSDLMSETFDKGQGLRIHTISKQTRVVAKQTDKGEENLFSIPLDYPIKFHVSKKNVRKGKGKSLREILAIQSLPIVVQFAKGHSFQMGSRKVSTDSLPALTLIDTFEETYLLCNTLIDDFLDNRPVAIPLYLKYIRLSRILGYKDKSKKKEFDKYIKQLDDQSTRLIYDPTYGNEDIAVYNPNDIHSCSQYAYLQPDAYSDISILYESYGSAKTVYENIDVDRSVYDNKDDDMNTYDLADFTHAENPQVELCGFKIVDWTDHTEARPSSEREGNLMYPFETTLQKSGSKSEISEPPPIQPKPTTLNSKKVREPPPIPPRRKPPNEQGTTLKGDNLSDLKKRETQSGLYEDIMENVQSPPLSPSRPVSSNQIASEATLAFHADVIPPNPAFSKVVKQKEPNSGHVTTVQSITPQLPGCQLSEMSIDQIGQCLKWLGLSHYVDTFKDNGVDGMILKEFDEQLLAEDFGFKKLEVIKMIQFIRRGHIPK